MTYQTFKECIESHLNEGYGFILNGSLANNIRVTDSELYVGHYTFHANAISNIEIKREDYGYCLTFNYFGLGRICGNSKNILIPISLANNLCEYYEGGTDTERS